LAAAARAAKEEMRRGLGAARRRESDAVVVTSSVSVPELKRTAQQMTPSGVGRRRASTGAPWSSVEGRQWARIAWGVDRPAAAGVGASPGTRRMAPDPVRARPVWVGRGGGRGSRERIEVSEGTEGGRSCATRSRERLSLT
jgi:hypothetical protein